MKTKRKRFRNSFSFIFPVLVVILLHSSPVAANLEAPPLKEESQETSSTTDSKETAKSEASTMTLTVGESEGELNISVPIPETSIFTGAATYRMPIEVPPGRGGIAPDLSLIYNSYTGNGWVGVGWTLDIGAIQRSTKWGLNYAGTDFIEVKNGSLVELIPRGDWGANYYGRKIEGAFSKYYYNSGTGGWEVTTKDGTKYYYGTTSASRQDNVKGVFKWCLDKVQDPNGNYMTITYFKDQGEIYLDRMDYTGNGGLGTTNYVRLFRETRTDAPVKYHTQSSVKTAYRLKEIKVYGNGQLSRKYVLNYTTGTSSNRSLMTTITQYNSDETAALPPTSFVYQDKTNGFDVESQKMKAQNYHTNAPGFRMADVNGDGVADFVYDGTDGKIHVLLGSRTGQFLNDAIWGDRAHGYFLASYGFRMADVNGDGCADFIYDSGSDYGIRVLLSNACSGSNSFSADSQWGMRRHAYFADAEGFKMADVNGDGLADFVYDSGFDYGVRVLLSTGSGFPTDAQWGMRTKSYSDYSGGFKMVDGNGDGLADFVYDSGTTNGVRVLLSNGVNGFSTDDQYAKWGARTKGYKTDSGGFKMADLNGDGLPDFVYDAGSDYGVRVLLNHGANGFLTEQQWGKKTYNYSTYSGGFKMVDANGDGLADFVYDSGTTNGVRVLLSNGVNGFSADNQYAKWGVRTKGYKTDSGGFQMTDMNGDGIADFIYDSGLDYGIRFLKGKAPFPHLLSQATNSIGGKTNITYEPSSSYENDYMPLVIQTVSSISINDSNGPGGNGTVTTTNYTYLGGYYDKGSWQLKKGREFRGFEYVKATDSVGTTTESYFLQDDIFKGLLSAQVIKDSVGTLYTQVNNTYEVKSPPPYTGVEYPYLKTKDDYICDGQPCKQVQTSFAYDSYGNLTQKQLKGDLNVFGDERYENAEYNPCNLTKWIVNRPSRTWITDKDGVMKAQTWYEYDNGTCEKGNLTKKTDWFSGGTNPITQYGYNTYGNQTSITDPKGNTTTIDYDTATYTYPAKTTIPYLYFYTEKTYDYRFGKVVTDKDFNGNITTYTYDKFGRVESITQPPDTTSYPTKVYSYLNFGTVGNPDPNLNQKVKVFLRKERNTSNQTWRETYFDGLGRTYLKKREGLSGKAICTEIDYNNRALISGRSLPYFEGSVHSYWTIYEYDAIGRVTKVTPPDGKYSTMSYDRGRTTIIDANKHAKVQEKDPYGRLIKVEEYQGIGTPQSPYLLYATTSYQYDVLNNLLKVIDTAGNQTTMIYDTLSRKVSMTDPDMCFSQNPDTCKWTYEYDANGNLAAQTDAKGQRIVFSFFNPAIGRDDPLNRVMKKDYPTGTDIVYTYDQAGYDNSKGRLTSVTDSSGMTENFYDERGRIKKTIKTVDAVSYPIETTYDSLDRIMSIKYPDLEIVSYTYDTAGNLSGVSGAANYTTYTGYNALGQLKNVVYGNGVTTAYTYDDYTNRLASILTSRSGQTLQNLSYLYDDAGNVTTITDDLDPTRTQQFQYDHLNRLAQADSQSYPSYPQPITYQYNQIGNMTLNSQVGPYVYGGPRPHAVTQAGPNSYAYDNNGNMVTGAGRTITYDYDNRPSSITLSGVTGFVYDYQGQRVKKTGPSSTVYIGKLYELTSGIYTKYIFAGTKRIASKTSSATNYYHTDHLQSSNVITDVSGTMVEEIYYFPYGVIRLDSGSVDVKHKYTGQEEDPETGLYYYEARYYDPVLARFISPDPIVPDPTDPQSLNRYSYVRNNPLRYIDSTGNQYDEWDVMNTTDLWGGSVYDNWGYFGNNFSQFNSGSSINNNWSYYASMPLSYNTAPAGYSGTSGVLNYQPPSSGVSQDLSGFGNPTLGNVQSYQEIGLLMRMLASEGSREYKIEGLLEGMAWTVPNRIELRPQFYGRTYEEVIFKSGQYQGLHMPEGIRFGDWERPLNYEEIKVHAKALTVAQGVYYGTISNPTQGAAHFHYGLPNEKWENWIDQGRFIPKGQIGPFYFYREVWP